MSETNVGIRRVAELAAVLLWIPGVCLGGVIAVPAAQWGTIDSNGNSTSDVSWEIGVHNGVTTNAYLEWNVPVPGQTITAVTAMIGLGSIGTDLDQPGAPQAIFLYYRGVNTMTYDGLANGPLFLAVAENADFSDCCAVSVSLPLNDVLAAAGGTYTLGLSAAFFASDYWAYRGTGTNTLFKNMYLWYDDPPPQTSTPEPALSWIAGAAAIQLARTWRRILPQ